jgi:predicted TIM-barrel fold metal-dependent hydrolase
MRIDVHTHIFPPEIVQERTPFFDGEPAFRLLYESPRAKLVGAETLIEVMDRDEIDCSVVFGFPWQAADLAARHNDYVLGAAARYPQRLIPLACVDPLGSHAVREAERCLTAGARGLGELAIYGADEPQRAHACFQELIACCRSRKHVLLVHANEPVGHRYPGKAPWGLDFYYELARMASGIPLIFAHWGGGLCFFELLKKEAREVLAHVYYDTAASPYLYRPTIYLEMVRILGKGKILFGSDFPLLAPRRYFQELVEAGVASEDTRAILGENAAKLFLTGNADNGSPC